MGGADAFVSSRGALSGNYVAPLREAGFGCNDFEHRGVKRKGFPFLFDKQMFVILCYTEPNERANASAVICCRSALGWTVHNDDGVPRLVCAMLARSSPSWNE